MLPKLEELTVIKIGNKKRWKGFVVQALRYPKIYLLDFGNDIRCVWVPFKKYKEYFDPNPDNE